MGASADEFRPSHPRHVPVDPDIIAEWVAAWQRSIGGRAAMMRGDGMEHWRQFKARQEMQHGRRR